MKKAVILLIITSLFFVGTLKINAETLYAYNKCPSGSFTWYYTSLNNKETVNVVFVPKNNSQKYKWSTNTNNYVNEKAVWNNYEKEYTGVRTFSLYVNMNYIRQGKIDFGLYSCLTPTFNSYDSTYEITSIRVTGSGDNQKLVVAGFAFTLTKNGYKIHNVNPTISLSVTNNDYMYLKESEFDTSAKNTYLKRCTYSSGGKYYKCPKDSYKIYQNSTNEAAIFNQASADKINLFNDYSYTRYYAKDWGVGNFALRSDKSTSGKLEYWQLFNLKGSDYVDGTTTNSYNIGDNLSIKKNNNWENASKADVINYFVNQGYKFYINGNFKFSIPVKSITGALSKSVTPTATMPITSLKFSLNIYDKGGNKTIYGKEVSINSVNSYITQVGVMKKVLDDVSLSNDTKMSFTTVTSNDRIKFLNVSTMRGRIVGPNSQMIPYTLESGTSPYFANTYGSNTIYHDSAGIAGKYYYYVDEDGIVKNSKYYPINFYRLKIRTDVKGSNQVNTANCTSSNNDDGTPCMRPASQTSISEGKYTLIYALGTWITPISTTNFKIGCKAGFTLFGNSCCPTSPINRLINEYGTNNKTCCDTKYFAKNYSTGATECCPTGIRTVYTPSGKINLCENVCPLITCPSGTQKDIEGKCCNVGSISASNGKCSVDNEVAVDDGTGSVCKVSETGGSCKCKPLVEEYTCKADSSSTITTKEKRYKVNLNGTTNKTTCSEKYTLTFNKEVSVLQGSYFSYPIGLTVTRDCWGGGVSVTKVSPKVTITNLPSYATDANIIKTAIADIFLKNVSVNATQIDPTLLEHTMANLNKKEYSIVYNSETVNSIGGNKVRQEIKYNLIQYKHDYYLNTFTGKIRAAELGLGEGYLPSGKYVYILLNAPTGKYNNDVVLNIHGNTIKIDCSYEIKENIIQKYAYRQVDTDKIFSRSRVGNNWKTETAKAIISKVQNSANEVYEEGRAMYEINLDSVEVINKVKEYAETNGYYNSELRSDGTSSFIYETFRNNILVNRLDNLLKDIIE